MSSSARTYHGPASSTPSRRYHSRSQCVCATTYTTSSRSSRDARSVVPSPCVVMREESRSTPSERQGLAREDPRGDWRPRASEPARGRTRSPTPSATAPGMRDCSSLGYGPTAGDQAIQHHDHGDHEQDVDQATTHMEHEPAEQPQYEQNNRECPDHREPPEGVLFLLVRQLSYRSLVHTCPMACALVLAYRVVISP